MRPLSSHTAILPPSATPFTRWSCKSDPTNAYTILNDERCEAFSYFCGPFLKTFLSGPIYGMTREYIRTRNFGQQKSGTYTHTAVHIYTFCHGHPAHACPRALRSQRLWVGCHRCPSFARCTERVAEEAWFFDRNAVLRCCLRQFCRRQYKLLVLRQQHPSKARTNNPLLKYTQTRLHADDWPCSGAFCKVWQAGTPSTPTWFYLACFCPSLVRCSGRRCRCLQRSPAQPSPAHTCQVLWTPKRGAKTSRCPPDINFCAATAMSRFLR